MNDYPKRQPKKKNDTKTVYLLIALAAVVTAVLIIVSLPWKAPEKNEGTPVAAGTQTTSATTKPKPKVTTSATTVTTEVTTEAPQSTEADVQPEVLPEFVSPANGAILKGYSGDVPVFSETMNDYRIHGGVDIAADVGSDVYAAADGTVSAIWEDPLQGWCMTVDHAAGAVSVYKNVSADFPEGIAAGTPVSRGQVIAAAGDTSLVEVSEEPHLHYELMIDGVPVNPADYMAFPADAVPED